MIKMPERIHLDPECLAVLRDKLPGDAAYVHADLYDAALARNAELEAKVADLKERLRKADKVIADLGRCVAGDCAVRAALEGD